MPVFLLAGYFPTVGNQLASQQEIASFKGRPGISPEFVCCYDGGMNSLEKSSSIPGPDGATTAMVDRWRQSQPGLEEERLQRLRGLSERDAALQFSRLLQISGPYPLRPTSGLVEQQRILARLRQSA
jgi:hypothetical protein